MIRMLSAHAMPRLPFAAVLALLACPANAAFHVISAMELSLFRAIRNDPLQDRNALALDPILCRVARLRATDMARRGYFNHVGPDGKGPNLLVTEAGYSLPDFYEKQKDANNIESIATGDISVTRVFSLWKNSPGHRSHVLGGHPFYEQQTRAGCGIATAANGARYFVFISAPPNRSANPPRWVLKDAKGRVLARSWQATPAAATRSRRTAAAIAGRKPPTSRSTARPSRSPHTQ